MSLASAVEVRGCRPLEKSRSTSSWETPLAKSSSRQARMATLRWAVGCVPPFTMSGMTMTTLAPGCARSASGSMPMGLRMLSSVAL